MVVNRKVKTLRGVTRAQIMIALSSPGDKPVECRLGAISAGERR